MNAKYLSVITIIAFSSPVYAQKASADSMGITKVKADTILGVAVYTAPTHALHIFRNNFHTYTEEAKLIKTDTGIIGIKTQYGYLDLSKNYQFIPLNKLQPVKLKGKP